MIVNAPLLNHYILMEWLVENESTNEISCCTVFIHSWYNENTIRSHTTVHPNNNFWDSVNAPCVSALLHLTLIEDQNRLMANVTPLPSAMLG